MMKIEQSVTKAVQNVFFYMRNNVPEDTGNMKYNATKLESRGKNTWRIYIDTGPKGMSAEEGKRSGVAPYAPYTNEPWDIKIIQQGTFRKGETRTVVRTWVNPNEGWWNRAAESGIQLIAKELGGKLTRS